MAPPHNDRRERYNSRRVRRHLDLAARIESVPYQVVLDELTTTGRLLQELAERGTACETRADVEAAFSRWASQALPAFRQFSITLVHLNSLLAPPLQSGGSVVGEGSRP